MNSTPLITNTFPQWGGFGVAPRRQRRCGVCRETGHDRRTCPLALKAVEETPPLYEEVATATLEIAKSTDPTPPYTAAKVGKKIRWSKSAKGRAKIKTTPPPPVRDVYQVAVLASSTGVKLKNEEGGDIGLTFCWDGEFIYRQGWFGKEEKICCYSNFRSYKDYKNGDYDKYNKLEIMLDELDWSEHLKMVGHWEEINGLLWDDYSIAIAK